MDGELIPTGYTYNQARVALNDSFSTIANLSGLAVKLVSTGNTYGVQANDTFIIQTGTGSVYLPDGAGLNRVIMVKNYNGGAGDIDIIAPGDIDGVASGATISPGQCITVHSDGGASWFITNLFV